MAEAEPLVSALVPVHNGARTLVQALRSLLDQTLGDLEVVVIDDGSTDATPRLLAELARGDPRLRPFRQERAGIARSLNRGLALARGRYIARLDADDLSLPGRLERQVGEMERCPELVIAGSAVYQLSEAGALRVVEPPLSDGAIRLALLFDNPFAHSALMLRRAALVRGGLGYNPAYAQCEDYELWSRLLEHGEGMNLPEPLVVRREHPAQASLEAGDAPAAWAERIARDNLRRAGLDLPLETVRRVRGWLQERPAARGRGDEEAVAALFAFLERIEREGRFDPHEVRRLRARLLLRLKALIRIRPGDAPDLAVYLWQRARYLSRLRRGARRAQRLAYLWRIDSAEGHGRGAV